MSFPYKNPNTPLFIDGTTSINSSLTFGNTFSVYNIGGYMEVFSLNDLIYTIPTGVTGSIEYSGNTIPIEFTKGDGSSWSPDVLTLYSDNISSGRRRLGMLVYVYEEDQVYQFNISGYTSLFTAATASTNCVVISDFGTTVKNNTVAGQNFINAWTASTIEDINGYTNETAAWRKFNTGTGGGGSGFTSVRINNVSQFTSSSNSYINFSGINLTISSVGTNTLVFSAGTGGGGGSSNLQYFITGSTPSGVTINSGDRWFDTNTGVEVVYINDGDSSQWVRPSNGMVPLFTGNTSATCITSLYVSNIYGCSPININDLVIANSGITTTSLTATTISATTYQNLPTDIRTTGGTYSNNNFTFTNNTGGTYSVLFNSVTGLTVNGGLTVTGNTSLQALTATTISATTYQNLPTDIRTTGATYSNNTFTFNSNGTGSTYSVLFNTVTGLTVNGNLTITGTTSSPTFTGNSLTLSNSASTISLNNTTQQQIRFFNGGTGAPTYNTYSAGAKIILSDNIDSISSGYAIGVDAGSLWYGSDLAGNGHDWYAGTRKLMSLASSSGLELVGLGGPTTTTMTISGTSVLGSKGGVGYIDFLKVVNNFSGATNPNKWFRVNSTGGLEILRSDYNATILTISDGGILAVGGGNVATTTSSDGTSNYLSFNGNNSQIYDDGNFHIHSRGANQAMWINANNGQINIGAQSPVAGGGIASAIAFGTGTANGYVTINTGRTVTTAANYGYLTTGGAGTYGGGSQSVVISLYANNRIWGQEIDAFSDERMKNIEGEISLEEGIKLVKNLKPIKYNWKEGDDKGIKAGYSAQQVIKSGFDHLIGLIPTEGLEETIDDDGFLSPKDTQFAMNYDQVTPYHGVVIKHLLEEIENLKNEIKELKSKIG